jgi:hypothetical protein
MEALLEREEEQVENWNDERLDELSRRMDAGFKEMRDGFDRLGREMKEGFAQVDQKMDAKFLQTNERIDRLMLTLLVGTLAMIGTLIGVAVL